MDFFFYFSEHIKSFNFKGLKHVSMTTCVFQANKTQMVKPLAERLVERIKAKASQPQQMCRILNGTSRRTRNLSYGFEGDEKKMSVRIVFYKNKTS